VPAIWGGIDDAPKTAKAAGTAPTADAHGAAVRGRAEAVCTHFDANALPECRAGYLFGDGFRDKSIRIIGHDHHVLGPTGDTDLVEWVSGGRTASDGTPVYDDIPVSADDDLEFGSLMPIRGAGLGGRRYRLHRQASNAKGPPRRHERAANNL